MASANLAPSLASVIPGFQGNTGKASSLIKELLSGKLSKGERGAIYNAGAERATLGGMPGSSGSGGSLFANADLRNIGRASGERQQQGFQDFLSMLQGFSGTVVPTAGQELQNQQFTRDLSFRGTQADRNYGLQQNEQDLNAAKFNEQYGPREFANWTVDPKFGTVTKKGPSQYVNTRGISSFNPSELMFKYRR